MKFKITPHGLGTLANKYSSISKAQLMNVDEFHNIIVEGIYATKIEAIVRAYRAGTLTTVIENGKETIVPLYQKLKKKLPYYVVQAEIHERRHFEYARNFTGLAPIDIDHLTPDEIERVMGIIPNIPWVKEAHRSARGEGLHLIVAMGIIDARDKRTYEAEYKRRYRLIGKAIEQQLQVEVDKGCCDVLRGFFMSCDPKAFLRPNEEVEAFDYPDSPQTSTAQPKTLVRRQLVEDYLTQHPYRPGERHGWWLHWGLHLKQKGIAKVAIPSYQEAMQKCLSTQGLLQPDDPLFNGDEAKEALQWGYEHGETKSDPTQEASNWMDEINDEEELDRLQSIRLPKAFAASLAPQPGKVKFPTLCGLMPIAQIYATKVEVRYCDGKTQRLNGMSCIVAEQGGMKSGVKDVINLWKQPLEESDAAAREAEEAYRELVAGKKANEKLPPPPKKTVIQVPPTISCSALLKRMKLAQGNHLYSVCEEIDTVRKTNGAGTWSTKYDIYRLSFDNGEWGQDYNSDQSESGMVKVAYNWTFMGTPQAMRKCFAVNGSVENGLTGRVWHCVIPPTRYTHMPKYKPMKQPYINDILRGVEILQRAQGFIDTPRLRKTMEEWCNRKADEAAKEQDTVVDTFRKRAAVIGFRAGVVFFILKQGELWLKEHGELSDEFMQHAVESLPCCDFATLVADHALKYQCLLYGGQLLSDRLSINRISEGYRTKNKNLFEELPAEFSFGLLQELRPGTAYNALRTMVNRWKKEGLIQEGDKNCWKKYQAPEMTAIRA
ncbi:MAG: BT4734/BF3469 family protein [Parabacteroides sp.]